MDLEVFSTSGLGDATYLVASDGEAALVDPQRDAWRFLAVAAERGWRVTHVVETHVHNDYLSGALEVRAATGARLVVPARGGYAFPHDGADEGTVVEVGGLRLTAMATPGHTFEHLAWSVASADAAPGAAPEGLFTGGSLLVGTAGRTDLAGADRTPELTSLQQATLRRIGALPAGVRILPTHGAGSFCSAGPAAPAATSTIGAERDANPVLRAVDEPGFAGVLLGGLGRYPAYYAAMAPLNRAGPRVLGRRPEPMWLRPRAMATLLATGDASGVHVVDARPRQAFAAGHIPGALNIELDDTFAAYVGWLLPFDAPLVLVLPDPAPEAAAEAVTQLLRVGYEHVAGILDGGLEAWVAAGQPTSSYPTTSMRTVFADASRGTPVDLLDVRQPTEWRDDGVIPGARTIFVADLPDHLAELPRDHAITVVCKTGGRAAIAASLLDAAGIPVRLVASGGAVGWPERFAGLG